MIVHQLKSFQMVNSSHLHLNRFVMNLTKEKERVKQNRDKLKQSSTDWYVLNIPPQKDELQNSCLFTA